MTREHLLRVLQTYDEELRSLGISVGEADKAVASQKGSEALGYVRWMCQQAQSFLTKSLVTPSDVDKANRWLGFIQGVLWVFGVKSIDQMRDDNRGG